MKLALRRLADTDVLILAPAARAAAPAAAGGADSEIPVATRP